LKVLRSGTDEDAAIALKRIRRSESLDNSVHSSAHGNLLLPTLISPPNDITSTQSKAQTYKDFAFEPGRKMGQKRLTSRLVRINRHILKVTDHKLISRFEHPQHIFDLSFYEPSFNRRFKPNVFLNISSPPLPVSRWTIVSEDDEFLTHLLTLFWTWDTTVSLCIDRTMFEEDLTSTSEEAEIRKGSQFCTPFLVNALLAVSCVCSVG
jgi:hypothetical protein